jgi:hypothetical protein
VAGCHLETGHTWQSSTLGHRLSVVSLQGSDGHQAAAAAAAAACQGQPQHPDLSQVGLVLWQSGFVLADFLLLRLAEAGGAVGSRSGGVAGGSSGSWAGVRVLELGCGGGTVGLFLALAGAQVGVSVRHCLSRSLSAAANFHTANCPCQQLTLGGNCYT